jgi:arylsulfatase A-like enzyme
LSAALSLAIQGGMNFLMAEGRSVVGRALLIGGLALSGFAGCGGSDSDAESPRPNIVLLLADDQRWDSLDATHSPGDDFVMPHTLRAIADQGVTFSNAFLTTPLCGPSRASILSGRYAHNTGVYINDGAAEEFDDRASLAVWLQEAGYRTGFVGKYMNGYSGLWRRNQGETPYVPPGWDEWHAFRRVRYFDYELIEQSGGGPVVETGYGDGEEDYSTDVLRRLAVDFVESTPAAQPYFLYVNFKAPHLPLIPAPRHEGMFSGQPPWRPPSFNEPDVSDKPTWVQETPPFEGEDLAELDETRTKQLEMLQAIDEAIDGPPQFGTKSIVQALRDRGDLDNTIVIYLSDNGWLWGEHRQWKKGRPYDEALRSPFFVRYPKLVQTARVEQRMVLNIDIAPTLIELARATVSPASGVDGDSLVPLLDGSVTAWRSDFLGEGWPNNRLRRPWAVVRGERWKYTEVALSPGEPDTEIERELYDLESDPYELDSLAESPEQAGRVAAMSQRLRELRPQWPLDTEVASEEEEEEE